MSEAQLLDYANTTLILVLKLSLLPIVVATVIGLIVSLLQALTARVKLYELTCNMEPDAARVAFEGMGGMLT